MQKTFEGEITLGIVEAFLANAMVFIIVFLGWAVFIPGDAIYVDMNVASVETELPIVFLSPLSEGGGDIMYYPFELQPQKPLTLMEVKISNEKESISLKHFESDYNITDILGNPLYDFVTLLEEPSEGFSQNEAKLYSKTRLMTSKTLEPNCRQKKSGQATEYFCEDNLNVLFVFKEGTANVHYKFAHKEIMRAPLFPLSP